MDNTVTSTASTEDLLYSVGLMGWKLGTTRTRGREQYEEAYFVEEPDSLQGFDRIDCGKHNRWCTFGETWMDLKDWRPDHDRNQLALMLAECNFAVRLTASELLRDPNDTARVDIYIHAMLQPSKAFAAICKAHRDQNV